MITSIIITTCTNSPSMQNGTSGEPQCASWDFDLKRTHLVHVDCKLHTSPS